MTNAKIISKVEKEGTATVKLDYYQINELTKLGYKSITANNGKYEVSKI